MTVKIASIVDPERGLLTAYSGTAGAERVCTTFMMMNITPNGATRNDEADRPLSSRERLYLESA